MTFRPFIRCLVCGLILISAAADAQTPFGTQQTQEEEAAPVPVDPTSDVPTELRDQAFDNAMRALFPLKPEEVRKFMEQLFENERVAATPPEPIPQPEIRVENISLEPGRLPPEIKVAAGFVTTISFLDASGQPWPLADIGIGGPFEISEPDSAEGAHLIRIVPTTRHAFGNLSVRLQDLATPLSFRIKAGDPVVFYRYDARVPRFGPNARFPLIEQGITLVAGDNILMTFLEGVPPTEATMLRVVGTDSRTRVWQFGEQIFVRTPLTLLSPGWEDSVSSADGTTVYALSAVPVLLLSENGLTVRANVDVQTDADSAFGP